VSGLGSTPYFFFGATPMARRRSKAANNLPRLPVRFPVDAATWAKVVPLLELSPQQTRIVELLLQGMGYKQIAAAMDRGVPTIRTQLNRMFHRLGVEDRVELILHVFGVTLRHVQNGDGRLKR
jgi:DNA-binding NarL/FixJ family response regulator